MYDCAIKAAKETLGWGERSQDSLSQYKGPGSHNVNGSATATDLGI